jgi:hypothetical protein
MADKLTLMQAREFLGIEVNELISYDKIISYTMVGLSRYYKKDDLIALKEKIKGFKDGKL